MLCLRYIVSSCPTDDLIGRHSGRLIEPNKINSDLIHQSTVEDWRPGVRLKSYMFQNILLLLAHDRFDTLMFGERRILVWTFGNWFPRPPVFFDLWI